MVGMALFLLHTDDFNGNLNLWWYINKYTHTCAHPNVNTLPHLHMNLYQLKAIRFVQALVECEGDSIDLSGDVGAVGRVVIPDTSSGNHDMYLDLKGTFLVGVLKISNIHFFISLILPEDI